MGTFENCSNLPPIAMSKYAPRVNRKHNHLF